MSEDRSRRNKANDLRRRAEVIQDQGDAETLRTMSEEDIRALVQELQVHKIELEMQNEELRGAHSRAEEAMSKYADLYDFAPVGYVTSNKEGLILEANLAFADQLGIERGRLINTPLWLYAAAPHRDKLRSHLDQVFSTNERRTCEVKLERPGGPQRTVQLDSIWVLTVDGTESCRTSVTDISIRKQAEEEIIRIQDALERKVKERTAELSESERKHRKLSHEFHVLLNAISDTLVLLSPDMELLWSNRGNVQQLNEALSEVASQYCYELSHGLSARPEDSPVARCFKTGENEASVVKYNGAILDIRAFPIKEDESVSRVLLLVSDITEKMALQAEAMQACHLASLGELAAGIAHEINNPVTGVINYGQILINECSAERMEHDIGKRIVMEGERIARIVRTLLSYARNDEQQRKQTTTVSAILEESIILTQAQIRKEGIDLEIDLRGDLPDVDVNFQQIQQGFINIITNARYSLNEKYPERHENKLLQITGEKVIISDRPYVRIVFHDRGVGIPPHELPMLTKAFFSTKPFGKGTGLGLNITDRIIKEHGGFLSFESLEGEFTRVIIDLPAKVNNQCRDSCEIARI